MAASEPANEALNNAPKEEVSVYFLYNIDK